MFFCVNLYSRTTFNLDVVSIDNMPNFIDYYLFVFEGVLPFNPTNGIFFSLPLMWMLYNLILAYVVGNYPVKDLTNYGDNTLTRIKSRKKWWIHKCIWNIMSVLVFYILGFLTILIFSLLTVKNIILIPNPVLNMYITGNDVISTLFISTNFLTGVFIVPIIISIAISLLQMTLSFILSPILSYTLVSTLLVSSAFLDSKFLFCNNSMLTRNVMFTSGGVSNSFSIIFAIIISLVSVFIGFFFFNKSDFMRKI